MSLNEAPVQGYPSCQFETDVHYTLCAHDLSPAEEPCWNSALRSKDARRWPAASLEMVEIYQMGNASWHPGPALRVVDGSFARNDLDVVALVDSFQPAYGFDHFPPSKRWNPLFLDLDRWARLPDDWSDDDGEAPSAAVLAAGRAFLTKIVRRGGMPVPESYIDGDGEIGYRWRKEGGYASASFSNDGHVIAYMHVNRDKVMFELDAPWAGSPDLEPFFDGLRDFA